MINQPDLSNRLVTDSKGLDQLKQSAKQNAPQSIKAVAQQFESMFMNMVMKSMREASGGEGGLLDNQQSKMFTSMLDQQLSQNMAKKGVGLADVLIRQLAPHGAPPEEAAKDGKALTSTSTTNVAAAGEAKAGGHGVATGGAALNPVLIKGLSGAGAAASTVPAVPAPFDLPAGKGKTASTAGLIASLGKDIGGLNFPGRTQVSSDLSSTANSALDIGAGIGVGNGLDEGDLDGFASLAGAGGRTLEQLRNLANREAQSGAAAGTVTGRSVKDAKPFSIDELKSPLMTAGEARNSRKGAAIEKTVSAELNSSGRSQPAHVRHFQSRLAAQAEEASRTTGIPAKFLLGQAALESGWGRREIVGADGKASHNLFGIKATPGWKGKVVEAVTTEYVNGVPHAKREKFRAYDSYADAFKDYGKLLSKNPRYENVIANAQDASSFARGLQRAGYATDPNYAAKLTRIINNSLS